MNTKSKQGTILQPLSNEDNSRFQQLKNINLEVLGERIRRARIEKKISQRDISDGLFTSAYLSSLELGKTRPTLNKLDQLAGLLGKSIDYFLRPVSHYNTQNEGLNEEQTRLLELRQVLLAVQVYLELENITDDDKQLSQLLEQLRLGLTHFDPSDQIYYYYLLGKYYNQLGKTLEAVKALQHAQELKYAFQTEKSFDNSGPELSALLELELGKACARDRQKVGALNHYLLGLEVVDNSNGSLRWRLLAEVASCYSLMKDFESARDYYQKMLIVAQANTLIEQANYFYKQAIRLSEKNDFQRANLYFGRAQQIYDYRQCQFLLADNCLNLAYYRVGRRKYAEARQVAQLALKLSSEMNSENYCQEVKALLLLASIHHCLGELEEANKHLDQVTVRLQARKSYHNPEVEGRYYQIMAEVKVNQGERKNSEEFYQRAIESLSQIENEDKINKDQLLAEIYFSYARSLKEWNEPTKSLELMVRAYQLSKSRRLDA